MIHSFYIAGSSDSAGIKVLILPKGEEAFIKTLGITIPPGVHALVGLDIKEVSAGPTKLHLSSSPLVCQLFWGSLACRWVKCFVFVLTNHAFTYIYIHPNVQISTW